MSRKASITLGLLVLLIFFIVTANALPNLKSAANKLGFGSNNNLSFEIPESTPAIGWGKDSDSVMVTLAPEGLSWSNVDKRDSQCTLPTGEISAGDYVKDCIGKVILVWTPSNSVLFKGDFYNSNDNNNPDNDNNSNDPKKENILPSIKITKPEKETLYIRDIRLLSIKSNFIIGYITIEAEIENIENIEISEVKLYIEDELVETFDTSPYIYKWNEKGFGEKSIKIVAYNAENEEICSDEISLKVFNLKLKS